MGEVAQIAKYLAAVFGQPVAVREVTPLGALDTASPDIKGYGYGTPLRVDYEAAFGRGTVVLHTIRPAPFGHEEMPDRARELLWEYRAFNHLPRHIRALDVGGLLENRELVSLGSVGEFCLLTEYAEGRVYAGDLERIKNDGRLTPDDSDCAEALCGYLIEIHKQRADNPQAYTRRIRELVGDAQCIMGLADSYPRDSAVSAAVLEQIEHLSVSWRWKLKSYTHRLRQTHGDFHPWNILFRSATDFTLLDRSRGEYGDPADDVTCLTLNYVFFSLQENGRLQGAFEQLFRRFWEHYLDGTGDREILEVVAPFFAFRALVMASPVWYPALPDSVRLTLVRFMLAVLRVDSFDPARVNEYCGV